MRIHICTICEKVSSAKRLPKTHKRWVTEGESEFDELKDETVGNISYDHMNGFLEVPKGHFVDCGPFVTHIAIPESELTGVVTMGV